MDGDCTAGGGGGGALLVLALLIRFSLTGGCGMTTSEIDTGDNGNADCGTGGGAKDGVMSGGRLFGTGGGSVKGTLSNSESFKGWEVCLLRFGNFADLSGFGGSICFDDIATTTISTELFDTNVSLIFRFVGTAIYETG
jgi:hypothetical protein